MNNYNDIDTVSEAAAWLVAIVRLSSDAILAKTPEGIVTSWNPAAEKLYGWTAEEIVGKPVTRIIPPDRLNEHDAIMDNIRRGVPVPAHETVRQRRDGQLIDVSVSVSPVHDKNGRLIGASSIARDIGETKRLQRELRAGEARRRLVADSIPALIAALDRDERVRFVNAAGAAWYGQPSDRLLGRTVRRLIGVRAHDAIATKLEAAMRYGETVTFETVIDRRRVPPRRIFVTLLPAPQEEVEWQGCFIHAVDITERHQAQEDLARRLHQQELVAELGRRALADANLEAVLQRAVGVVAKGLDVELAKILELAPPGESLVLRAGIGWDPDLVGDGRVGAGRDTIAGLTLAAGKPLIVSDLREEDRFSGPALLHEHGAVSGVSVRIAGEGGEPFGTLSAYATRLRRFTTHDINFVEAVAHLVAGVYRMHRANEQQSLLAYELRHRAGNMLATTMALARLTLRHSPSLEQFAEAFEGRVEALTRAQSFAFSDRPTPVMLNDLVEFTLAAYGGQIAVDGAPVEMHPDAARALSLILYELQINASKYGALSRPEGRIRMAWRLLGEGMIEFEWCEENGPPVVPPSRFGFGTRLMQITLERRFGGKVANEFNPTGLVCRFTLPVSALRPMPRG